MSLDRRYDQYGLVLRMAFVGILSTARNSNPMVVGVVLLGCYSVCIVGIEASGRGTCKMADASLNGSTRIFREE